MNDFTKEELESLKWCVRQAQAHNQPDNITSVAYIDGFVSMIKKIQSMIDNYCEHEWDNACSHKWDNGCCGSSLDEIICLKCKRKLVE